MSEGSEGSVNALRARVGQVRQRIAAACALAGRSPDEVLLVAVTKAVGAGAVRAALATGLTDFGENRVQEAEDKIPQVGGGRWHLVGHLQRNKARPACALFACIHSVDSERLVRRLEHVRDGRSIDVLIQVNLTGATTQDGMAPEEVESLAHVIGHETGLSLRGLMTIGPFTHDEGTIRQCFRGLRELRDDLRSRLPQQPLAELSMGMTDDFEIAIQEGATMVRVGRAVFGERTSVRV